ncbi:hypothetical protein ALC56_12149 [Trachymyrmex septentrionalis]|uniref:Uncharacterized protein n=1 Tax=Trachymyrmex septentrionalis TaxID=34720 RepID=A0A195EZU8_9HYME|nr:hypothetical protein ALC56_12149 [Trachymyrmex septentrionalis]
MLPLYCKIDHCDLYIDIQPLIKTSPFSEEIHECAKPCTFRVEDKTAIVNTFRAKPTTKTHSHIDPDIIPREWSLAVPLHKSLDLSLLTHRDPFAAHCCPQGVSTDPTGRHRTLAEAKLVVLCDVTSPAGFTTGIQLSECTLRLHDAGRSQYPDKLVTGQLWFTLMVVVVLMELIDARTLHGDVTSLSSLGRELVYSSITDADPSG